MSSTSSSVVRNFRSVLDRIQMIYASAPESAKAQSLPRLVAVSKTKPQELIQALLSTNFFFFRVFLCQRLLFYRRNLFYRHALKLVSSDKSVIQIIFVILYIESFLNSIQQSIFIGLFCPMVSFTCYALRRSNSCSLFLCST